MAGDYERRYKTCKRQRGSPKKENHGRSQDARSKRRDPISERLLFYSTAAALVPTLTIQ